MAQCSQTAFEFIQGAYGPMIAVLCTEDAEIVCQKNNLNFVELIRPFSQLTSEAHIRDPLNNTHPVKGWKLRFVELSAPTPSKDVVNQLLNDVVSKSRGPDKPGALSVMDQMKASTPWFEAFRDCFIQMVKPSDHEFIRHFLGCLFVVSSNNTDPLNAFQSLSSALDNQQPSDSIHSKWFSTHIFKYYLMIHDVTDGVQTKAEGIYQSMKSYYGSSICHMLMINSRSAEQHSPNLPDPWSQFIISTGEDTLKMMNDETDSEIAVEIEEDEVVVDENFDPLVAVKSSNETSPPLIGPLSFENEDEKKIKDDHLEENDIDGRKTGSPVHSGTRQFSGGLLSQVGSASGQHGARLTISDHDRIKIFIHELAIRGLIPFIERSMRFLYEQITARKGLHKSFFHATKKWFGGGKPVGQTNTSLVPGIIYESDSAELLWRKLGDLAFLVQNYELAYNCYHAAKRDYNTNHAWLYFAGALEMASISAFMAGGQRQYPSHYMETSISTYIDACRQHQFATRATLFGVEAFKSRGMYSEAAFALLKMTGEESDLLSAILLEQAAHCFLRTNPPRVRKYAFNMILAGHRFSKASQRKHALRCYKHSLSIYHKSWRMAEDHINFIIGRQSFNLRQLEDALLAFRELLLGESLQTADQQASYLREYLFVFQQLNAQKQETTSSVKQLPILPLPKLTTNSARIIFTYNPSASPADSSENTNTARPLLEQALVGNPFEPVKNSDKIHVVGLHSFQDILNLDATKWEQIELETYERVSRIQAPPNFRHFTPCLTNATNNVSQPRSIVNETIGVEVMLENELRIPLTLSNMTLLWTFIPEGENEEKRIGNELEMHVDFVHTEVIKQFSIAGNETKPARLSIVPLCSGNLKITGIRYSLGSATLSESVDLINTKVSATADQISAVCVLGRLDISVRGARLNGTKVERSSVIYDEDNRLNIIIVEPMPRLEVTFSGFPSSLLCCELQKVNVTFSNKGEGPLHKLHLASTNANLFTFDGANTNNEDITMTEFQEKQQTRSVERVSKIPLPDGRLEADDKIEYVMWIQGGRKSGISSEKLLFYYESSDENPSMSHRTVRHQSTIKTNKSLVVRATAKRCKVASHEDNGQGPNVWDILYCRSNEESNQLVVTLEVENLSSHDAQYRTFSVLQVSCVSKKWLLKPLSHQEQDGLIVINQGETVMTHFKAVKRPQVSDIGINNLSFTDKEKDISRLPYWEFFRRSNTWKELNEFETRTDGTMSVDLALVVLWESSYIDSQFSKHTVLGQSDVAVVTLAESISAPILAQPSKRLSLISPSADVTTPGNTELYIKYTVQCPGTVTYDFKKQRFCEVTVNVTLHNCSSLTLVAFVEMLAHRLESDNDGSASRKEGKGQGKLPQIPPSIPSHPMQYHNAFLWTGKRSRKVTMAPSQTIKLTFSAKIFKTGVFNLNHCRVLVISDANEKNTLMVIQKPPPVCVLVVRNSNEDVDTRPLSPGGMLGLFDYEAVR
ncbi:trafficking protein particle complex subunit 8-like [Dendronephthya gigantea]|uniref:trafficking protein particle complex subunit 8-like n=1 Tax=Dendronephthya gigantea TaxID=151771 RepID=UPI001068D6D4|nr:trafficking protein particle complex subunit 8-like [Dendronephthya gigantea]